MRLRPIGAVCHEADYFESACNDLIQNYRNNTWRVENPGKSTGAFLREYVSWTSLDYNNR